VRSLTLPLFLSTKSIGWSSDRCLAAPRIERARSRSSERTDRFSSRRRNSPRRSRRLGARILRQSTSVDEGYSRLRREASREARCRRWARPCRLKIFSGREEPEVRGGRGGKDRGSAVDRGSIGDSTPTMTYHGDASGFRCFQIDGRSSRQPLESLRRAVMGYPRPEQFRENIAPTRERLPSQLLAQFGVHSKPLTSRVRWCCCYLQCSQEISGLFEFFISTPISSRLIEDDRTATGWEGSLSSLGARGSVPRFTVPVSGTA